MKRVLLLISLLLFAGLISSELFTRSQVLHISPLALKEHIRAYSDTSSIDGEGGKSTIELNAIDEEELRFTYTLSNQYAYYYSGVELFFAEEPIDITAFDRLELSIDAPQTNTIRIFFLTHEPGISEKANYNSLRHLRREIPIKDKKTTYSIPLAEFFTPAWWQDLHGVKEAQLIRNPLTKVAGIKFESGEGEPIERPTEVAIAGIKLTKSVSLWVRLLQMLLLLAGSTLLTIAFFLRKNGNNSLLHRQVELSNRGDEELEKVIGYIGESFHNQELKLDIIGEACCMHPDRVASIIKNASGQTFKQYLNAIRLDEAQRLLKETDRQISEVAYAVGYSSVSHFNRIFKAEFGVTPTQFRTKK